MFWNIYLGPRLMDQVWYSKDCDAEYVLYSLINHGGYPRTIKIEAQK